MRIRIKSRYAGFKVGDEVEAGVLVACNTIYGNCYIVHDKRAVNTHVPEWVAEIVGVSIAKEDIMFTDWKSGQIFETKKGNFGLVLETEEGLILFHKAWGSTKAAQVNKNYFNLNNDYSIKAVYSGFNGMYSPYLYSHIFADNMSVNYAGRLIWRDTPPMKEVTLEEIAKKFNVNVKQLRIKDYDEN